MKKLETSVESLKNAMGVKEETEVKVDDLRYDDIFKLARSVKELTTKVCEFEYRQFKDGGQMICVVCGEHFKSSKRRFLKLQDSSRVFQFKNSSEGSPSINEASKEGFGIEGHRADQCKGGK